MSRRNPAIWSGFRFGAGNFERTTVFSDLRAFWGDALTLVHSTVRRMRGFPR
jgi:hypothetical protein